MDHPTLARLAVQVEQYLTASQVAAHYGCSAATVMRAVRLGELRGVRIGRDVRISPEEAELWDQRRAS